MMTKPSVAFKNEEAGRTNIERKLKYLATMLNNGAQIAAAPKSLRQFNAWSFVGDSVHESFARNAHETLTKYSPLRSDADELTRLAKKAAKQTPPARELSVKRARERSELHLKLRQIAERHALQVMSENEELRRDIEALRSQINSMSDELASIRDAYEEELQKVRSRNAELIRSTPSTIKVLRKDV